MLPISEFKVKYNYAASSKMTRQYLDIKFEHQDTILFFRVGDFYELFFEDAIETASLLGITLTARSKGEDKIPMCGVPHSSLDAYLHKLVDHGLRVAICDQLETPEEAKKRGNQEIVRREVVQIVTQGTITEESILDTESSNYLLSIVEELDSAPHVAAISYLDLSTFEFGVLELPFIEISSELVRLNPKEILASKELAESDMLAPYKRIVTSRNHYEEAPEVLTKQYGLNNISEGDTPLTRLQQCAAETIISYIALTQKRNLPNLPYPKITKREDYMLLDSSSLLGLEILRNQSGGKKHTLLAGINHTVTKHGARLLAQYLSKPLVNKVAIDKRLDITEFFYNNHTIADKIRKALKGSGDIERLLARVASNKARPQDLLGLKKALEAWKNIKSSIGHSGLGNYADKISVSHEIWGDHDSHNDELLQLLTQAIKEDCANVINDGGYINPSYHPKLLELSNMLEDNSGLIEKMRNKYKQATGIENLKIAHNNILGLFIEVSSKYASKMTDPRFIHRGTTANAVRFTTEGLRQVESDMVNAKTLAIALEQEIFEQICGKILMHSKVLREMAARMAELDVFCSLAYTANTYGYVKPEITDDLGFVIKEGRHIIAERSLDAGFFTPNDCNLSPEQRLWLITGPNMAGKSTFLRQNALIAILAQVGSFVPASHARIGIVDKLFSRIGAGDDMSKGQSTFMIEMLEVALILNSATKRSLVILDEVGRGTSTHDGLAIAQSCLEYIHNNIGCRSLFATHYHELIGLSETLKDLRNHSTSVDEADGKILFLHKIIEGGADKSYGIHVAELAGLPSVVVERAKNISKDS